MRGPLSRRTPGEALVAMSPAWHECVAREPIFRPGPRNRVLRDQNSTPQPARPRAPLRIGRRVYEKAGTEPPRLGQPGLKDLLSILPRTNARAALPCRVESIERCGGDVE